MKMTAIMNIKGGVGKTVTAVNTAAVLARLYGKRVLIIDADPQGDATAFFHAEPGDSGGLCGLLEGDFQFYDEVIFHTDYDNLDILPSTTDLFDLDRLADRQHCAKAILDLKDAIAEDNEYDVVLVDCPPSFTAASIAALAAADSVIIPVKLDAFSVRGMEFLLAQVRQLNQINNRCAVDGILITQWHNAPVVLQAEEFLRAKGLPVFDTKIRRTDKVDESTWYAEPLEIYSRLSAAGIGYRSFVAEWMGNEG